MRSSSTLRTLGVTAAALALIALAPKASAAFNPYGRSSSSSSASTTLQKTADAQGPISEMNRSATSFTVKNGFAPVKVHSDTQTKFFKDGKPAKLDDFFIGDEVRVFGGRMAGRLTASEVRGGKEPLDAQQDRSQMTRTAKKKLKKKEQLELAKKKKKKLI